jgi:hypothetical protein
MFKTTTISAHALGALALFVALGGTAMANDSVRALITGADVRDGSLTGRDVRNRSLTAADLAPNVLRTGPAGPQGPAGERGPAGPDLAGATYVRVRGDRSAAENGAALRGALASITDASASKPYVIQLAPGVYDVGGTTLAMKPDVSIAGAGSAATRITGDLADNSFGDTLVMGADRTVLRDVTVVHRGDHPQGFSQTTLLVKGRITMRVEDAVLQADTTAGTGYAFVAIDSSFVEVRDSRLEAAGRLTAEAASAYNQADITIRGSELTATAPGVAYGVRAASAGSTAVVEHSAIVSTDLAVMGGTGAGEGPVTIGASRLVGRVFGRVACVASYNGSFAAVGAGCT